MNSRILLSEKSVELVIAICEAVRRNLPKNQKSVEMADGIAEYVEDKEYLSEKQAQWVCQNADYWKMKKPRELARIIVGGKVQPQHSADDLSSIKDDLCRILLRVERIERKLDKRMAKSRDSR